MKNAFLLFTVLFLLGRTPLAQVNDEISGTKTFYGILTTQEHDALAADSQFQITLSYSQYKVEDKKIMGTLIRNYKASATIGYFRPLASYIGKTLVAVSNQINRFCASTKSRSSAWSDIRPEDIKLTKIEEKGQLAIEFEFQCYEQ